MASFSEVLLASFLLLATLPSFSSGLRPFTSRLLSNEKIITIDSELAGLNEDEIAVKVRKKRSADEDEVSSMASAFHLNNSHLSLMVNWVGKDSSIVFVLAKDQEMKEGATSNVSLFLHKVS